MRLLDFSRINASDLPVLKCVINQADQTIFFSEHPYPAEIGEIVVVCPRLMAAAITDFFDVCDFFENSDYNPIFLWGQVFYYWELPFKKRSILEVLV